ncbi:MAG: hypothetical protein VXW32_05015 [Myxococcota bacterium]|nr:hypothetical protein [Myxococcota bacterium]
MGVWDHFKKAKEAGTRWLDRIDEVEREARENDPHKEARRLAFQASETELTGGVEELEGLSLANAIEELVLEEEELQEVDELLEEEQSISAFDSLATGPAVPEGLEIDEVSLSDELELDETGTLGILLTSDFTEVDPGTRNAETTSVGEFTVERGPLEFPDNTSTGELTQAGESTSAISSKFLNTLDFSESEVSQILKSTHYPQLQEFSVDLLVDLARFEQNLLDLAERLGRCVFVLLNETIGQDEDWEAAVWTTGAHWDHTVKQARLAVEKNHEDVLLVRTLAWAFWPFTDELLSAAVGLEDTAGLGEVVGEIERVLDHRWAMVSGGASDLQAEGDHLPIRPRGIFSFEGFRWQD